MKFEDKREDEFINELIKNGGVKSYMVSSEYGIDNYCLEMNNKSVRFWQNMSEDGLARLLKGEEE